MPNLNIENPSVIVSASGIATELNLTGEFNVFWRTFVNRDGTPDISGGTFFETANSEATDITDFDGNTDCLICVKGGDAFTTLIHDVTKLFLRGGMPTSLSLGDMKWFIERDGVWYELPNP